MIGLQKIKRRFSVAFQKKMSASHLKSLEEEEGPYGLCCNGLTDINNNNNDDLNGGLDMTLVPSNGSDHTGERFCKCKYQQQKAPENGARDVVKDFDHISVNDSGCPSCSSPTRKSFTSSAHYLNGHINEVNDSPIQRNGHHLIHSSTFGPAHYLSRSSILTKPCPVPGGGDLVRTLSDRVDPCTSDHKEEPVNRGGTRPKAASKKSFLHYHQRFRKNGMTATAPSGPLRNGTHHNNDHHDDNPSSNGGGNNSTTTRSLMAQCKRHHIRFFSSYGFSKQANGPVKNNSLSASYSATGASRLGLEPATPSSTNSAGALKALSQEEISKRLSLPADIHIPDSFLTRNFSQPILNGPLSRKDRRDSLYEIGFGRSDTYTKLDKVGEGTYATVYRGRSRLTDNFVALKEIRLEYEEGAPCTAIREVSLLKNLKHANIVTLHDIVHTTKSLTLVFEYLERDLKQYMEDCDNIMNINNVKLFLFQLFRGLEFCHRKQILHRDLKPQNLLINKIGELKLADFGLARAKSVPTKTFSNEVVTLWYRPPEVLLGSTEYSTPIDMWGVGCIFYEMANGKPLFPGSTVEDQLQIIFKTMGTPAGNQWPGISLNEDLKTYCPKPAKAPHSPLHVMSPRLDKDGINFLGRLLMYDPKKRISAKDGLRHPYFKSFPEKIHHLPDTTSIFVLPGIKLSKDPGSKSSSSNTGKFRRQSLL